MVTTDEFRPEQPVFLSRRNLFKTGAILGGGLVAARMLAPKAAVASGGVQAAAGTSNANQQLHLAATDGWASMPSAPPIGQFWPDPLATTDPKTNVYVFGFRDVTRLDRAGTPELIINEKGKAQISAPILAFDQFVPNASEADSNAVRITLSNLGLATRPDLVDGHTIHWHGFTNAIPLFDGVPELSISVPIGREFTYYYRPHDPGTYMYHCHFEDVEHVQMGMTGVVYVRPARNAPGGTYAYDADASRYDREYAFMLTELWVEAHYRDAHIQTTDWTEFKPSFWLMNGRAYPDTLMKSGDPFTPNATPLDPPSADGQYSLRYNPISSVVGAVEGDKVLLRLANLGYEHHAMTLNGIPMTVIAKDASPLVGQGPDLSYDTNTVEVGPGESRDVIVRMPSVANIDSAKGYQAFRLYDRNYAYLNNGGDRGYGGQMTEVRLFPNTSAGRALADSYKQIV
jgi:FtsP/CotA-like multicopper oxidase with cupredoxin domain